MQNSIYKNKTGKRVLQENYDRYLEALPIQTESTFVQTSFGTTHVLVAGPKNGKPIFLFQGGNSINPVTFSWFISLTAYYRVYAPDTNGHPGYSDEVRISGKDESFAKWTEELMDYFKMDTCAFIGPSFGGGIILRLAAHIPEKIACAVLIAPAGLGIGPKLPLLKHILRPLALFNLKGGTKYLDQITDIMSDGAMKEIDRKVVASIFNDVKLEQNMPKLTTKKELLNFHAPIMVIAGEKDIFFPASKINAAAAIFQNLIVLKNYNMAHFPNNTFLNLIQEDIQHFLQKYY